jgi:hypothetical protein
MYDKDYYIYNSVKDAERKNANFHKASKYLKDNIDIQTQTTSKAVRCYTVDNPTENPIGIWYSTDNGEHWMQSNITSAYIGSFFEYTEKPGYPTTAVAADYNYGGLLYSTDGNNWTPSKTAGNDLNYGRFIDLKDLKSEKFRTNSVDITATATITAKVYVLSHAKPAGGVGVSINPVDITTNNSEVLDRIREILDYIHHNYNNYNNDPYYLRKFDDAFWSQLISDIKANTYKMENAIRGDRIIE